MKSGSDDFFAIIGEGARLLKSLDENSSGFFDSLNRLREILAMLGEVAPAATAPAITIVFSLSDKESSAEALREYLDEGMAALPVELATFEAETVADLASLAGNSVVKWKADEWLYDNHKAVHSQSIFQRRLAAFDTLAARGVQHGQDQAKLTSAITEADALMAKSAEDDPAWKVAHEAYNEFSTERMRQVREMGARMTAATTAKLNAKRDGASAEALAELQSKCDALRLESDALYDVLDKGQIQAWEHLKAADAAFHEERANSHRALFEVNGNAILSKVLEASPVSEAAATAWANEQIIDDNAKAKLKKMGYPPADVIRDMAEFYRMTGGKASAIRIGSTGRGRASASGIEQRLGEKTINLGSHFNKTVLFHELAHHLENDPIAKAASNGFLIKRREGEQVHTLRSLTGSKGYRSDEVAYKDGFTDPYVGKVYRDGVTEVWSMGVQYLASPKDAAIFAAKDPEMFALITGYLTMPTTPAMRAKLDMHKGAIDEKQAKEKGVEELYEKALAYLAGVGTLVKDDWHSSLDPESELAGLLRRYVFSKEKSGNPKYIGRNGEWKVFSGTYRNKNTKRYGKGFLIVDTGETSRMNIPDYEVIVGDIEQAQAMVALAIRDGLNLSSTFYNYFHDSSYSNRKQKLIDTVGAEYLK